MEKKKPRNYYYIHWALRIYKKGKCKKCGLEGKTQLARKHDKQHEKKIGNYVELCSKCHIAYDRTEAKVAMWRTNLSKSYSHRTKIQSKKCEHCLQSFAPAKKSRRFCSNSCSSKWKFIKGITHVPVKVHERHSS